MRIAVFGAGGQLGRELIAVLGRGPHHAVGVGHHQVDIVDPAAVAGLLDEFGPDAVINCAAWTRVDAAEAEEAAAQAVNAGGPRVLAEACSRRDILLCQLSTDYVFDGSALAPMGEATPANPRSAYGRTKLAGEEAVRGAWWRHQIVRTAWLYGQAGPNFVLTMLRLAGEQAALRVVADQQGSPTWTGHLAPALVRLLERGVPGTYHLTNSGVTSWHGLAVAIMAEAGLDIPVAAIAAADYPAAAARPAYSVLDNRAWRELGEPELPGWREGLRRYLDELGAIRPASVADAAP